MTRWALKLEYDGTGLVGWQRQADGLSVQQILETAAARLASAPVASTVAGRTDAGVHAAGQVAHLDMPRDIAPASLRAALNFHMQPHPVVVLDAATVSDAFSARFSATGRRYDYVILNRPARPALAAARTWHVKHPLDIAAMQEAARILHGRHDFSSFRAASCQASGPVRTLDRLAVRRDGEMVTITAEARSFLHHQVRNIVGTLVLVGRRRWPPGHIAGVLAARDRRQAGPTAPACGLTLTAVAYDPDPFSLPEAAGGAIICASSPRETP